MAETKAYVRLDKVGASDPIESVVAGADLYNGQFVDLGVIDESIGYDAAKVTNAVEGAGADAIVASVFVDYGSLDFDITEEHVKAGKVGRAFVLRAGQVFSLLKEQAPEVAVGDKVTVGVNGFGVRKAAEGETVIGTAIRTDYLNNIGDLITIRIK